MKYQPVYIEGWPYAVRLPTGGSFYGEDNEWDQMLDVLGEKNPVYHAKNIHSWCQDADRNDPKCRVYRGQISPRHRNSTFSYRCEYAHIGYRPVLEPLYPRTLRPSPEVLQDMRDGTILTMGSFYIDGQPQPLPTDPDWCGNIPQYRPGCSLAIGDTDAAPENWLRFIKCGNLLWCDRNLLTCVSWDTLCAFGLVDGRAVQGHTISQYHTTAQKHTPLEARLPAANSAKQDTAPLPHAAAPVSKSNISL